jgi:hypothetical protein
MSSSVLFQTGTDKIQISQTGYIQISQTSHEYAVPIFFSVVPKTNLHIFGTMVQIFSTIVLISGTKVS